MKKLLLTISFILTLSAVLSLAVLATSAQEPSNPNNDGYIYITYDTNGGSEVKTQKVLIGSKLTAPAVPTKQGYDFDGWYIRLNEEAERTEAERSAKKEGKNLDEAALVAVDANDELWSFVGYVATENMTLTAKWVPNDEMPPMEMKINGDAFVESLGLMAKGLIGIFVVTLVIIGVVAILNWHGRSLDRRKNKK